MDVQVFDGGWTHESLNSKLRQLGQQGYKILSVCKDSASPTQVPDPRGGTYTHMSAGSYHIIASKE